MYRAPPMYLASICGNLSSLGKSMDYFYAIQMGECPRYQMMKGPQRNYNANMLMSTIKFGFKDTLSLAVLPQISVNSKDTVANGGGSKGHEARSISLCVRSHHIKIQEILLEKIRKIGASIYVLQTWFASLL